MSARPIRAALAAFATLATCSFAPSAQAQTSPSDFTSATRYDAEHRVTGTIAPDPDGSGPLHYAAVRNSYDAAGSLIRVEKGELSSWQSESTAPASWTGFTLFSQIDTVYDVMDRKLTEAVSSGGLAYALTQYSYDAAGRLECTAVRMNPAAYAALPSSACTLGTPGTQGADRITRTVYDAADQVLKVQKAYGSALQQDYQSYGYTLNGKAAFVIDANGNKAAYGYDGFDREVLWAFPSTTVPGAASTTDYEAYGYDANGNRTSMRRRDGRTINYAYDALNRPISKTFVSGGACVSGYACTTPPSGAVRNVYYGYDLRGLQTYARFDSTSGADAATNVYDGFGRLTSSNVSMGGVSRSVGQSYDADGNRIRATHPDGTYFTYEYDGLDRPIAIRQNGGTQVASYSYDARNQRAAGARGAVLTSYGYDPISRLASLADDLSGASADVTVTFGYNPASQIIGQTRSNDAYAFAGYTVASNTYTANRLNQYTAVGAGSLGYDSNGNLASTGGTSLTYDVENRLVAAAGTLATAMVYDPMGRLYQTTGASGVRQFLYDGDERIGEYDGSSGALLRRYVHGNSDDDPLLWYEGSGLTDMRSLQSGHQGSIVSVADASGALIAINSYDEYGVPGSGNIGTFQYTGQAWLPDLGMYYYKARIYASRLGRFLQTDPIGYADQINLYAYGDNDPVNGADPTGKSWWTKAIKLAWNGGNLAATVADVKDNITTLSDSKASTLDRAIAGVSIVSELAPISINDAKGAFKFLKGTFKKTCCFVAGTLVQTQSGLRPIEQIKVGDLVLSRNAETGEQTLRPVTDLIQRHDRVIWKVATVSADGKATTFETTDDHPWWSVEARDWKRTDELAPGMLLETADGRSARVSSVTETTQTALTYNLEVADFHTYFVGDLGVWVHNSCSYTVPGSRTRSGKDYHGSTGKSDPSRRGGNGKDGRDRQAQDTTREMPGATKREREIQEQRQINNDGGLGNVDNKINPVSEKHWGKYGIDPPK